MTSDRRFIVVGAGLGGAGVAKALRDNDFDGLITVIGAEEHLPYERPPLSKEHLSGDKPFAEFTVAPDAWYRDHRVELLLGTEVRAIDPAAHTVTLPDDSTLSYDKLALATGSRPRAIDLPGADAPNVYTLRTLDDSDTLRELFAGGTRRLAVVGAGWIGLEVAAAARNAGVAVTVVENAEQPLLGVLGPEMGAVFAELHREHDVDLRLNTGVAEITTRDAGAISVATGLRLDDGTELEADAVLIAVGAVPEIGLAEAAGLDTDKGVLVDEHLRTSDPDIVAVGDIAEQQHPVLGGRIRVEHWATALNQPEVAAKTMLGREASYDRIPYFFTDQYDLGMEYTGYVARGAAERVVVRGDTGAREFVAFWLDGENRVLAGMNVNVWDVTDRIRELVAAGEPADPDRLADTSAEL
ncbi:NAD(P)/FAD-dependent oxidoreductase [Nocardia jiangsuensis]|uniref:NAD(P)/FAD-dependent oxidoreductase n=1 Tax=Nocardia jiangsuensis TaxID=1691563 RepID=A0ABV8E252_9NOCA